MQLSFAAVLTAVFSITLTSADHMRDLLDASATGFNSLMLGNRVSLNSDTVKSIKIHEEGAACCRKHKYCFKGVTHAVSFGLFPFQGDDDSFVEWNATDSKDWVISRFNRTKLIVKNPGLWNIQVRFPVFALAFNPSRSFETILAGFTVNGKFINSTFTTALLLQGSRYQTVSIEYAQHFKRGDRVQLEIGSSNSTTTVAGDSFGSSGIAMTLTKLAGNKCRHALLKN